MLKFFLNLSHLPYLNNYIKLTTSSIMKKIFVAIACITITGKAFNQDLNQLTKGQLNGSFENYSQYYMKDEKIAAAVPQDKVGSNSFFKLDYTYGKFSSGLQYESYLPSILGYYNTSVNESKLINKYFKYTDANFSVQVGDFYEQFGSGLIFRAFENRQIGINNSLDGVNIHVNPTNIIRLKAFYGKPRKMFEIHNSTIRGFDSEFDVSKIFSKKGTTTITLGGSYVGRYQEYTGPQDDFPSTVNSFATRLDISSGNFAMNAEYVNKSADPHLINANSMEKGRALQINTSYTKNNFGLVVTARAMSNMDFRYDRENEAATLLSVNYLPALTKQHDFLTSNIYVYNPQPKSETGFQADIFYYFKPGSKLGGKYGIKISANYAYYTSLKKADDLLSVGTNKYFSDANVEIKKKWSKELETSLTLQTIFYNASVIQAASHPDVVSHIIAGSALYKYAPKKSVRIKLEHLCTHEDLGGWVAGIAEASFSSPVAFYVSDLYNYDVTKTHYYNVGASVTKNATRFSLGFGRQRAGLFCVGGVCRFVPAAYGFTATLTTSFGN